MAKVVFDLKRHLTHPLTLKKIAKEIGIGNDQMIKLSGDKIISLNKFTLGKIIAFMRANGKPDFDVADLLKYVPD